MTPSTHRAQVFIIGAGPVGLTLAMDLARRGVDVLVAELRRHGEAPVVKCNHVSARSMEVLRRLCVAQAEIQARGAGGIGRLGTAEFGELRPRARVQDGLRLGGAEERNRGQGGQDEQTVHTAVSSQDQAGSARESRQRCQPLARNSQAGQVPQPWPQA